MSIHRPHRIVVLALDGVIPFELGIPSRVFGMARDAGERPLYEVITCGLAPGPIRTTADFGVVAAHGMAELEFADTVIIPASYELGGPYRDGSMPSDLAAAMARIRPGTRVASICTAAFILAAAGLLDNRRATTHWMHTAQLQRLYPRVKVDPNVLFVDEGEVLTSAGVAAGLDLCLHMLRCDHGSEVANSVARRSVVPPWRDGGQAQYIEQPVPEPRDSSTASARSWALDRLETPVSLSDMASQARMSVRTFTRRFREEVGMTPGQWLITQRVELARQLLESSQLPADHVARQSGFGTAASMRRHLTAALGVSPMTYRRTFQAARR